MEKINGLAFKSSAPDKKDLNKKPEAQSPLLQDTAKDSLNISNKKPAKKNHSALKWVLGSIGVLGAILVTVRVHNIKLGEKISKSFSEAKNKLNDLKETISSDKSTIINGGSRSSGGFSSKSSNYHVNNNDDDFINNCNRSANKSREQTQRAKEQTNAANEELNYFKNQKKTMEGFESKLNNLVPDKSLETLKKDILSSGITNLDKPFEAIDKHFGDWDKVYDEDLLINMYAYIKKMPHAKNPVENERNKQCGVYLLSKLKETIHEKDTDIIVNDFKTKLTVKKIHQEVDHLLDHYFGKVDSQTENINSLPIKTRNKLKEKCEQVTYGVPHLMFTQELDDVAGSYLREIKYHHVKNGSLNEEGKKLLSVADILNKKAIEINTTMKTEEAYFIDGLKLTADTIERYKKGTFKTKFEEECENNDYTATYKQKEALKTFKNHGQDLGKLNALKEDALKKAYRKLAMQLHPDKNPGDKTAHDKFVKLQDAYQELLEEVAKK